MSYQVLARKWRPRNFSELVGQEHVVRALTNALDLGRLHHAYLFTGTRGVGKTTLARILAKALNCEQGLGSAPCGVCAACREIEEGRFADLLEVDAASRTRVDETRELLENVPYAPIRGRFKIYLIDEVHMFSGHSFNALLKTLEEPPPHVKFLLATTDPKKLPVTILSRCLQFNLKHLPVGQIGGQLQHILEQESAEFEEPALALLARAADGSMRDALSLMDQALAFGAGRVTENDVRSMLGDIATDQVHNLLSALADRDGARLLRIAGELAEKAADFTGVLSELLEWLHRIALVQVVPNVEVGEQGDDGQITALAERLSPEDIQLYYQIGIMGQRDLSLAPDPRSGFEMVLLRMLAFRPESEEPLRETVADPPRTQPVRAKQAQPPQPQGVTLATSADDQAGADKSNDLLDLGQWDAAVKTLGLGGIARQLADNCSVADWNGKVLELRLDPVFKHLHGVSSEERLLKALRKNFGEPLQLKIKMESSPAETPATRQAQKHAERQHQAEQAMANDPLVQAMESTFTARVVPDSVKPLDD